MGSFSTTFNNDLFIPTGVTVDDRKGSITVDFVAGDEQRAEFFQELNNYSFFSARTVEARVQPGCLKEQAIELVASPGRLRETLETVLIFAERRHDQSCRNEDAAQHKGQRAIDQDAILAQFDQTVTQGRELAAKT